MKYEPDILTPWSPAPPEKDIIYNKRFVVSDHFHWTQISPYGHQSPLIDRARGISAQWRLGLLNVAQKELMPNNFKNYQDGICTISGVARRS